MIEWTREDTKNYLNRYPLPVEFKWPHVDGGERSVYPVHSEVIGYGKWLKETPNFPGLFELVHELIDRASDATPISPEWIAAEIVALRKKHPDARPRAGESIAHALRRMLPLAGQATLF